MKGHNKAVTEEAQEMKRRAYEDGGAIFLIDRNSIESV